MPYEDSYYEDGKYSKCVKIQNTQANRVKVGLADNSNEVNVVHDNKTGLNSLLVCRSYGKNSFTEEYTANQTNLDMITPAAGKKLALCGGMSVTDANSGVISLDFATSNIKVWRHYVSAFVHNTSGSLHIIGAADEPLRLNTTTGATNVFIIVCYREVD